MKKYPIRHILTPVFTNAHVNRRAAVDMLESGIGVREIAREFPRVFRATWEGNSWKLGLKYSFQYARTDGLPEGLLDMDIVVSSEAVTALISARNSA